MPDSNVLNDLASRVEGLTGADREVDALVTIGRYGFPEQAYHQRNGMRPKGSPELDRMKFMIEGG